MKRSLIAFFVCIFGLFFQSTVAAADLPATIEKVKPSIVAIGTYKKTRSPPFNFRGTGFVFGAGNRVATNAHVLPEPGIPNSPELAILSRLPNGNATIRPARVIARDNSHDVAIIGFDGPVLLALALGDASSVKEGQGVAFTGFPIGGALGFSPTTHRGIISAIVPIALPSGNSIQLNEKLIKQLRSGSFDIFQLDATAYPGNSGSPVFDPESGQVIGIINMVFIKSTREAAISTPSGITYAIPINYLRELAY
ncbi:MAG: serine protease [Gammaproteobacteria bacterium]|nr:serine protease [Gammaproteobacteria bacterium]MBU2435862.1 serine protease [Gammaproteobacteria bacterium]MBU2449357.1 serine protease [Gammaproteobacteria bacterium]